MGGIQKPSTAFSAAMSTSENWRAVAKAAVDMVASIEAAAKPATATFTSAVAQAFESNACVDKSSAEKMPELHEEATDKAAVLEAATDADKAMALEAATGKGAGNLATALEAAFVEMSVAATNAADEVTRASFSTMPAAMKMAKATAKGPSCEAMSAGISLGFAATSACATTAAAMCSLAFAATKASMAAAPAMLDAAGKVGRPTVRCA